MNEELQSIVDSHTNGQMGQMIATISEMGEYEISNLIDLAVTCNQISLQTGFDILRKYMMYKKD